MIAPREDRPVLDRWLERVFGDDEPGRLGTGWLSFMSHLLVQVLSFLTLLPAVTVSRVWEPAGLAAAVRALPLTYPFRFDPDAP